MAMKAATPRPPLEPRTIRAAVLHKSGEPLAIEELQLEAPRADEVLVRLVACGICHTDIRLCESGIASPAVLGHEGAGVIEAVGAAVKSVKRGDHVVLTYQSCGRCGPCVVGRPAECARFWDLNFGFARRDGSNPLAASGVRGSFFGQSSFATHTLATERNLVRVGKSAPLERLAPLGCSMQTGAGTIMNSLAVRMEQSVAVFGVGAVGLAAVMTARIVGAGTVIAVDIIPKRLKLARELGANEALDNRKPGLADRIRAITGRGVDNIVETTGDAELRRIGVELLNPGGGMALLTGDTGREELDGGRRVFGVLEGDAVPQRFIPYLVKLHRRGEFPYDRFVRYYNFADINRAIEDAKSGATIKPVLRMGKKE
jgi:aryl-alcohol dehydrogenase